jgi:hypothetical protein
MMQWHHSASHLLTARQEVGSFQYIFYCTCLCRTAVFVGRGSLVRRSFLAREAEMCPSGVIFERGACRACPSLSNDLRNLVCTLEHTANRTRGSESQDCRLTTIAYWKIPRQSQKGKTCWKPTLGFRCHRNPYSRPGPCANG